MSERLISELIAFLASFPFKFHTTRPTEISKVKIIANCQAKSEFIMATLELIFQNSKTTALQRLLYSGKNQENLD